MHYQIRESDKAWLRFSFVCFCLYFMIPSCFLSFFFFEWFKILSWIFVNVILIWQRWKYYSYLFKRSEIMLLLFVWFVYLESNFFLLRLQRTSTKWLRFSFSLDDEKEKHSKSCHCEGCKEKRRKLALKEPWKKRKHFLM